MIRRYHMGPKIASNLVHKPLAPKIITKGLDELLQKDAVQIELLLQDLTILIRNGIL
jgi:hypothetical protein